MARGQNASTGRTARSEGLPRAESSNSTKFMPAGSVDNIVAQYERAKAYDERIRSMSPDEIKKEVEDIKQFGVISNAQVDAIIVAQENVRDNNYEARINLLEREKVLFARVVDYLDQRRTENPKDDIASDWGSLEGMRPYQEKYKELVVEIEKDEAFLSKKWPGKTPDIKTQQGRDAERNRRVIIQQVEERLRSNKDDLERIEADSIDRLKSVKDTFYNLFKL
jgi:hypothetical protein